MCVSGANFCYWFVEFGKKNNSFKKVNIDRVRSIDTGMKTNQLVKLMGCFGMVRLYLTLMFSHDVGVFEIFIAFS